MTYKEFNFKWKHRLEEGHYGLAIAVDSIVYLCDKYFERWSEEYPDFTYSQIKYTFGTSRVYCENIPSDETYKLEQEINELL